MSSVEAVYVGIDYHPGAVQVCVMDQGGAVVGRRRLGDDAEAIHRYITGLGPVRRVAVESCCGAADLAEELAERFGLLVDLAHPGYVARMKKTPDKTDLADAHVLADLTRVGYLPKVWLAPRAVRELRLLVRYRQSLVEGRRNAKLRLRAVLRQERIKDPHKAWSKPWIIWLTGAECPLSEQGRWVVDQLLLELASLAARLELAHRRLEEATAGDELVRRLREQPGIGPVTAWVMRAELGRLDRFATGKALSHFCGLSPRNASSGGRQADAGLVKAGSTLLRTTLIEAAWRLIHYDERWKKLAGEMRGRGKPGSVVAAAVANRWVRALHFTLAGTPRAPGHAAAAA